MFYLYDSKSRMKGEILFSLFNLTAFTTVRVMYYDREEKDLMLPGALTHAAAQPWAGSVVPVHS